MRNKELAKLIKGIEIVTEYPEARSPHPIGRIVISSGIENSKIKKAEIARQVRDWIATRLSILPDQ